MSQEGPLGPHGGRIRANLSGWVRERTDRGIATQLSKAFLSPPNDELLGGIFWSLPPLSFHERADRLLLSLEKETAFAGNVVLWNLQDRGKWVARAWALNREELDEIVRYLTKKDFIFYRQEEGEFRSIIQPDGWAHLEEIKLSHLDSRQGFIAMWFDGSMTEAQGVAFEQGISDAGYGPQIMNRLEHVGRIDDRIMTEIKQSRFIVADFTGHRGGVYFEAGYAMGLGIPVIWTCRRDHMQDLHFDIRQYNCLDWEPDKLDDFKERLRWRIENVCGRGRAMPPAPA
jgi:hypothetical protein